MISICMENEPLTGTLYNVLACPKCKADLSYSENKTKLVCPVCKKEYEIRNGIPVFSKKK
jgi:hypothetical protein